MDASDFEHLERDPGFLDALDTMSSEVGERFRDLPEAEGRVRESIARLYLRLRRYGEALEHARRSYAIAQDAAGFDRNDRASLLELVRAIEVAGGM